MASIKDRIVLVVDDEPILAELISDMLEMRGCKTIATTNPKKALEIVQTQEVDAVVSDIRMPGFTGVELLKAIRDFNPKTPIVAFVSGYSEIDSAEAKKLGAVALLDKPVDFDFLERVLQESLTPKTVVWNRKYQRYACNLSAELEIDGVGELKTRISNFGSGGFFAEFSPSTLPSPEKEFNFHLTGKTGQQLNGRAVVRWRRDFAAEGLPVGIGAEFISVDPQGVEMVIATIP